VLSVVSATEVETHVMHEKLSEQSWAYLIRLRMRAEAAHVNIALEGTEGIPAWEIAAVANRLGADLIVIGHRHRSLWRRCMEASVAKRVIDRARCNVIVVP